MSRAERLILLIEEFRRRRCPVPGPDLARVIGVSIRTLYRDIASLRALGADVQGEPGLGYVLRAGFLLPPVMFTAEEVDALILGARWVAGRADQPLGEAAQKAMARLTAVLPADLSDRIAAKTLLVGPGGDLPPDRIDMAAVRQAIHRERKLRILYADGTGAKTERTLWPILVSYFDGGRLLSAWCELRGDIRHFRTDRILSLTVLPDRYPSRRHALIKLWREAEASEQCRPLTVAGF